VSNAKTHPGIARYRKSASCTETANLARLPISTSNLLVIRVESGCDANPTGSFDLPGDSYFQQNAKRGQPPLSHVSQQRRDNGPPQGIAVDPQVQVRPRGT
jgi:hypothetical protein